MHILVGGKKVCSWLDNRQKVKSQRSGHQKKILSWYDCLAARPLDGSTSQPLTLWPAKSAVRIVRRRDVIRQLSGKRGRNGSLCIAKVFFLCAAFLSVGLAVTQESLASCWPKAKRFMCVCVCKSVCLNVCYCTWHGTSRFHVSFLMEIASSLCVSTELAKSRLIEWTPTFPLKKKSQCSI